MVGKSRNNQVKSGENLVLIDGNAIMHRAYHALPPLSTKNGKPSNATYGFLSMLLTLVKKFNPTHLIVCFDRPEPTFRKQMYVGYQAHRPKMDDELSGQFDMVKKVLTAMDVPIYELAGYEADDIIGTLAFQATKRKVKSQTSNVKTTTQKSKIKVSKYQSINGSIKTIIVTGDRDILQLINENVTVYMPIQGLTNGKLYDERAVTEKFGIAPQQVVDYKALAGDASDNYPGVRGIGPKTASTLLQTFETVEKLYKAIEKQDNTARKLTDRTLQALSEYVEDAGMAKKLAIIKTDVPVMLDIEKAALHGLATNEAIRELEELGFRSLVKRLKKHETMKTLKHENKRSKDQVSKGSKEQRNRETEKQKDNQQMSLL